MLEVWLPVSLTVTGQGVSVALFPLHRNHPLNILKNILKTAHR